MALGSLDLGALLQWQWGFERESQRVDTSGHLATTPHPSDLGHKLTHRCITTDFAEAQLELISGVHSTPEAAVAELERITAFTNDQLDGEYIWPLSAPPHIADPHSIQVADMGPSFAGRLATTYRTGLVHRYGAQMQMVSGVHVNISLIDDALNSIATAIGADNDHLLRERIYLAAARSVSRRAWMLYLLFGASPRCDASFLSGRDHNFLTFLNGDMGAAQGTTLRMSEHGYRADTQNDLWLGYASLDEYIATTARGLQTFQPQFASEGHPGRAPLQLSESTLQLEAELYVDLRLKCSNPKPYPLRALKTKGVDYIECRSLDVDPWSPAGVNLDAARFVALLAAYGIWCELAGIDTPLTHREAELAEQHSLLIASRGREPGLKLPTLDWEARLDELLNQEHTSLLDFARKAAADDTQWLAALAPLGTACQTLDELPSQRMAGERTSAELGLELAKAHAHTLSKVHYSHDDMEREVKASIARHAELDSLTVAEFAAELEEYKRQRLEGVT